MGSDNKAQAWNVPFRIVVWISAAAVLAGCGGSSGSAPPPPTASISYPSSSLSFVAGTAITPAVPTASQGLSSFSVTPALPAGLSLNSSNGTISGTPTTASAAATYTVTASGGGATATASLSITVNPAPPSSVSYASPAFTFTTNVAARTLTPTAEGGAVASFSISPSLPVGLTFDTTTGAISGTPTAASAATNYVVTAQNGGGQATVTLTIEVDPGPLLDLGHDSGISVLRMSGSSVLSLDTSGHWNLWDYTSAAEIASGNLYCAPSCSETAAHLVDMAGTTVVLATANGFEVLSASSGQVLSSITASVTWWSLASDGTYLAAGSSAGLFAWLPTGGSPVVSLSGNYQDANAYAAPGQIQVAGGPAGQSLIQTVSVSSGTSTNGPAFNGQFSSWFLDGSRFITTAGTTALVYTQGSVQQAAITLPSYTQLVGQGNWVWTLSSTGTVDVFPIATGSTPTASFSTSSLAADIPSATTIALNDGAGGLSVIDLSGATPTETNYTLPIVTDNGGAYAAISSSQWMFGNGWGVLLDGASLGGTPRYFDYGTAWSIAGSNGSIAVATASGRIVYFNASTLTQEGVIPFSASRVSLSSDGTVLAAAGDENDFSYNDDWSIRIYSLPAGGSPLYTWPYSFSTGPVPYDMSLSGSGSVLGQVLFTDDGPSSSSYYTQQANPTLGGAAIFSSTFNASSPQTPPPPVLVSPDGTLIATSTGVATSGPNPGTNIIENGTVATAVTGLPTGWIDDGHLVVNTFAYTNLLTTVYAGCTVYSPSGQSTGPCALPQVTAFQPVTSDTVYALNLAEILSVSTGSVSWASGDVASQVGAVASSRAVFVSGAQVLAQGY